MYMSITVSCIRIIYFISSIREEIDARPKDRRNSSEHHRKADKRTKFWGNTSYFTFLFEDQELKDN